MLCLSVCVYTCVCVGGGGGVECVRHGHATLNQRKYIEQTFTQR